MQPKTPRPDRSPPRRRPARRAAALALLALLAGCSPDTVRALNAEAAANGTAGPPNNGVGGRGGGN